MTAPEWTDSLVTCARRTMYQNRLLDPDGYNYNRGSDDAYLSRDGLVDRPSPAASVARELHSRGARVVAILQALEARMSKKSPERKAMDGELDAEEYIAMTEAELNASARGVKCRRESSRRTTQAMRAWHAKRKGTKR